MNVSELSGRFSNLKQCGNSFVAVTPFDIAIYKITEYRGLEPLTVELDKVVNNPGVDTWAEVEDVVFGKPEKPDFIKALA